MADIFDTLAPEKPAHDIFDDVATPPTAAQSDKTIDQLETSPGSPFRHPAPRTPSLDIGAPPPSAPKARPPLPETTDYHLRARRDVFDELTAKAPETIEEVNAQLDAPKTLTIEGRPTEVAPGSPMPAPPSDAAIDKDLGRMRGKFKDAQGRVHTIDDTMRDERGRPMPPTNEAELAERSARQEAGADIITGAPGYPRMYKAGKELIAGLDPDARTPEQRWKAGTEMIEGGMQAATPAFLLGGVTAPLRVAGGLALGTGTGLAAEKVTEMAGGSPQAQEFAKIAGFFVPSAIAVAGARGVFSDVPGGKAATLEVGNAEATAAADAAARKAEVTLQSAATKYEAAQQAAKDAVEIHGEESEQAKDAALRLSWAAREAKAAMSKYQAAAAARRGAPAAAAGVAKLPGKYVVGGRIGSRGGSFEIPRAMSPDAAEAGVPEQPKLPPTEAETRAAEITRRMAVTQAVRQGATPPEPPPPNQGPENLTPAVVGVVAQTIAMAPPEAQPALIKEAHANLAKWMLARGTFQMPDGTLEVVKSQDQADKLAAQVINEGIAAHDKAATGRTGATAEPEPTKPNAPQPTAQPSQPEASVPNKEDVKLVGGKGHETMEELPETVDGQVAALKSGTVPVVFVPSGSSYTPETPKGMAKYEAPKDQPGAGTYIYDPQKVDESAIAKAAADGTQGALLGHLHSRQEIAQAKDAKIVQARDKKTGAVLQDSVVDASQTGAVRKQTAMLQARFPGSEVRVKTPAAVLAERQERQDAARAGKRSENGVQEHSGNAQGRSSAQAGAGGGLSGGGKEPQETEKVSEPRLRAMAKEAGLEVIGVWKDEDGSPFGVEVQDPKYPGKSATLRTEKFKTPADARVAVDAKIEAGGRSLEAVKASAEGKQLEPYTPKTPIEVTRQPHLTEAQKAVEEKAIAHVKEHIGEIVPQYIRDKTDENGTLHISSDDAKAYLGEGVYDTPEQRTANAEAIHPASAAIAGEVLQHALAQPVDPKKNQVIFLSGIQGVGKSTVRREENFKVADAAIINERDMSNLPVAEKAIDQTIASGREPQVVLVTTQEPTEALGRALGRAKKMGRTVRVSDMARIHAGLPEAAAKLEAKYGDKLALSYVEIKVGADGQLEARPVATLDEFRAISQNRGDRNAITNQLDQHLYAEHQAGRVSAAHYRQFRPLPQTARAAAATTATGGEGRASVPDRAEDGGGVQPRQPEQEVPQSQLEPPPNGVGKLPVAAIRVAPHRFQFKLNVDAAGVRAHLKSVHFRPALAQAISVWKDPDDQQWYVVNGHHRLERARAAGVKEVNVFHINAHSAQSARKVGALQNIAEGTATAIDAAKFIRDSGYTPEDLEQNNVPIEGKLAKEGMALASLDDAIFRRVVEKSIGVARAVAIARATPDHAQQKALLALIEKKEKSGRTVSPDTIMALGRRISGAGKVATKTEDLFGTMFGEKSTALEEAEVEAYARAEIQKDKRLFTLAGKQNVADRLGEAGNVLKVDENEKRAQLAAQALELFDRLANRAGPVADALREAGTALAGGAKDGNRLKQAAYGKIRSALQQELAGGEKAGTGEPEGGDGSGGGNAGGSSPLYRREGAQLATIKRNLKLRGARIAPADQLEIDKARFILPDGSVAYSEHGYSGDMQHYDMEQETGGWISSADADAAGLIRTLPIGGRLGVEVKRRPSVQQLRAIAELSTGELIWDITDSDGGSRGASGRLAHFQQQLDKVYGEGALYRREGEESLFGRDLAQEARDAIDSFVSAAGKNLSITPEGEQNNLFGAADKRFVLKNEKTGDERLVYEKDLQRLINEGNPTIAQAQGVDVDKLAYGEEPIHEMTSDEYLEHNPHYQYAAKRYEKSLYKNLRQNPTHFRNYQAAKNAAITQHHAAVEQAFADGKPVPDHVLSEYPDLYERSKQGSLFRLEGGWPSASEAAIHDGKLTATTGSKMLAALKASGVDDHEIAKLGLAEFLKGRVRVTPEQLQQHIDVARMKDAQPLFRRRTLAERAEIAQHVSFDYQPAANGLPPVIWVNQSAKQLLDDALGDSGWQAVSLDPPTVQKVLGHIGRLTDKLTKKPAGEGMSTNMAPLAKFAPLYGLRDAIRKADSEHPQGGVALATKTADAEQNLKRAYEEQGHILQRDIGHGALSEHADVEALYDTPEMSAFLPAAKAKGYDPADRTAMVAEMSMKIMLGEHEDFNLTREQAAHWLQQYFSSIAERHGDQVAAKLRPVFGDLAQKVWDARHPADVPVDQRVGPPPTFVHKAVDIVERQPMKAASAEQWLATLDNPRQGIKAEEMQVLGVREFLGERKGQKVTKDEFLKWLKAHALPVRVRLHAGDLGPGGMSIEFPRGRDAWELVNDGQEEDPTTGESRTAEYPTMYMDDESGAYRIEGNDEYGWHLLYDGGANGQWQVIKDLFQAKMSNVREIAGSLARDHAIERVREAVVGGSPDKAEDVLRYPEPSYWLSNDSEGEDTRREILLTAPALRRHQLQTSPQVTPYNAAELKDMSAGTYQSGHWDEPDVVAHLRTQTFNKGDENLYHIDEIQSDVHQEAREGGYQPERDAAEQKNHQLAQAIDEATPVAEVEKLAEKLGLDIKDAFLADMRIAQHDVARPTRMPFAKNWPEVAFKYALRDAIQGGHDWVTWTTGDQQNERWGLSKHVSALAFEPTPPDYIDQLLADNKGSMEMHRRQYDIEVGKYLRGEGGPYNMRAEAGEVVLHEKAIAKLEAAKQTGMGSLYAVGADEPERLAVRGTPRESHIPSPELDKYVGKELAEKLRAKAPQGLEQQQQLAAMRKEMDTIKRAISNYRRKLEGLKAEEQSRYLPKTETLMGLQRQDEGLSGGAWASEVTHHANDYPQEIVAQANRYLELYNQADKLDRARANHLQVSGLDLDMGGEGMREFYDRIVPRAVEKYVKQWGAKVEKVNLGGIKPEVFDGGTYWGVRDEKNNSPNVPGYAHHFATHEMAQQKADAITRSQEVWGVKINDAMRKAIASAPQYLYRREDDARDHGTEETALSTERQGTDRGLSGEPQSLTPRAGTEVGGEAGPDQGGAPRELNLTQYLAERGVEDPGLDHGMLGPSGHVSARAERMAKARQTEKFAALRSATADYQAAINRGELTDPTGRFTPMEPQPSATAVERERMLRTAAELESLAERGMKPRAYRAEAARLRAKASEMATEPSILKRIDQPPQPTSGGQGEPPESPTPPSGPLGGWLDNELDRNRQARWLQDGIYDLEAMASADRLRASQLLKKAPGYAKDREQVYHHLENPKVMVNAVQQRLLDEYVKPLMEESDRIYQKLKARDPDLPLQSPEGAELGAGYVHRVARNKGSIFDRILSGGRGGSGGALSRSASALKGRTYQAVEDEQGNRRVVSERGGRLTMWRDGRPVDMGKLAPAKDQGELFTDKGGKDWKLTEATTREIEAATPTRYYHDALASALESYVSLRRAERASDFLEAYKGDPEFKQIALKVGAGNPPKGWEMSTLPEFRGYYFEPHVREVLDWYAQKKAQGDAVGALERLNRVLRTAIFFNPLIHTPNIAVHWAVEKGAVGWRSLPKTMRAAVRAIDAVTHQNQDFLDALDAGAPLQSHRIGTENLTELLFAKLAEDLERDETGAATRMAKAVGMAVPNLVKAIYGLSSKVTWTSNDLAFLQAAYEKVERGWSLRDALKETAKHIPDYRLPVRIFNSRSLGKLMSNPLLTMFGAYHYGALKSYGEMAKSVVGVQQSYPPMPAIQPQSDVLDNMVTGGNGQGTPPPDDEETGPGDYRSKAGESAHGAEMLAVLGLFTFLLYPLVDDLLKKVTGDDKAELRRAGAATLPYNLYLMSKGEKTPTDVLTSVVTPAIGTQAAIEMAANRDLRTGRRIYNPRADAGDITKQLGRRAANYVAPAGEAQRIAEDPAYFKKFVYGLGGVRFPKHGAERIASDIAAERAIMEAETPDQRRRYLVKKKAEEAATKGDFTLLDQAYDAGDISKAEHKEIANNADQPELIRKVNDFPLDQFMLVWRAATPEEKKELEPVLWRKINSTYKRGDAEEAAAAEKEVSLK